MGKSRPDRESAMFSKINHVAIVSYDYVQLAQFYEAVFGMRTSAKTRPGSAVTVGDGYVGLNINPRRAGRAAGLDHFGIEVEEAFAHARENRLDVLRPFAGITTHDPDGNVFDISFWLWLRRGGGRRGRGRRGSWARPTLCHPLSLTRAR
jgi:catechol 2,3-dioxygenase-like lactoylglutathione lyase family enzyme